MKRIFSIILTLILAVSQLYAYAVPQYADMPSAGSDATVITDSRDENNKSETVDKSKTVDKSDKRAEKTDKNGKKRTSYWRRLFHGNEDHTFDRKFDVSFVAAPSYTREASFGIGGLASGLYRLDRTDSLMQPSDVNLTANASLSGSYVIGIGGNNYFKGNRSRLTYDVTFANKPLEFWGIDYASCVNNAKTDYTRTKISVNVSYLYKIINGLLAGVSADFSYANITKINDESYLQGQKRSYTFTGIGASLQYDTRDFIPNPQSGIYIMADLKVYPTFMSSYDQTPVRTTVIFDSYHKVWKDGIIATDIYGQFNSKGIPWVLREELGGGYRMRGYYQGRYIDNNIVSCQAELRQRIYRRIGATVWAGCGTVFPQFSEFNWKNILPSYGVGIRWEFKHRVNIRVDYGFGKHTKGFIFNINEAF